MGPQDVEYVKLKKLIDVVEEEPEGKRRSRGQEGVVDKEKKEDEDVSGDDYYEESINK